MSANAHNKIVTMVIVTSSINGNAVFRFRIVAARALGSCFFRAVDGKHAHFIQGYVFFPTKKLEHMRMATNTQTEGTII